VQPITNGTRSNVTTTYEIPTFLNEPPQPLELVAALDRITPEPHALTLHCTSKRYLPTLHNYYGSLTETVWDEPTAGQPVTIRLDFLTDEIIRIRYAPGDSVPSNDTPMVVGTFDARPAIDITEAADQVRIQTTAVEVTVIREPWQLLISDRHGKRIFSTRATDIEAFRRPEEQWNPAQQRWIFYHRYAYPLGHIQESSHRRAFLSLDLHYDEHIYGFGESYGRLDKRETQQTLWLQEAFGNASPAAYKRTPFYISTQGYGLFLNTANAVRAHIGDLEHTALSLAVDDTTALDLYVMVAPTPAHILPLYTRITGQPAVPPKWTFGLWMARISYNSQTQVEQVAADLRAHRIPCDVIHIDTNWYKNDWECDLEFCDEKFPDPKGMMDRLREQGFRVSLWQWPNMILTSPMFHEARERGFLVTQKNGQPYLFPGFYADASYIDYSNPAAVEWMQAKFAKLFALGVAAIKVDFGEGGMPDAHYHNLPSESAHGLYPLLYNKAIWEITERTFGQGKAVVWARAAWAGSQRYPIHWSGDGISRFEDLACVVRAALSFGLSGFPFYSHDIGGFAGLPDAALYIRWAQLGFFSSHTRAHGTPPREPWHFGEQAESIFRAFAELRYRLLPYIYHEAVECGRTSLPMLRALVLDYPDDPNTFTLDDQYLFGSSLLVAPILDESNRRRVYLPEGTWIDWWSHEAVTGGRWITVECPLEQMPIWMKAGAIIPLGPVIQHTDQPQTALTVLLVHPGRESTLSLHEEDAADLSLRYRRVDDGYTIEASDPARPIDLIVIEYKANAVS
jgi:alpha-D-xyloside xylohydrolase